MTDPAKLSVLRAMTDTLKMITPANGYVSDLSDFDPGDGVNISRVYRGRAWFGESDPLPLVSILEGVSPVDEIAEPPVTTPSSEYWWPLLVQGFVSDDDDNPTDPAYILLADVRQCLATQAKRKHPTRIHDRYIFGMDEKLVQDLRIGSGIVRPADDISAIAYFWLTVEIRIFDRAEKPYG